MSRERKVRTVNDRPADPSTDFLGERAWKAIARQAAIDAATHMLKSYMIGAPGGALPAAYLRQVVDGILGTIGPFYEAAIRDAILRFIYDRLGMGALEPEPVTGYVLPLHVPDGALEDILRFMWRQVSEAEMEAIRGHRR